MAAAETYSFLATTNAGRFKAEAARKVVRDEAPDAHGVGGARAAAGDELGLPDVDQVRARPDFQSVTFSTEDNVEARDINLVIQGIGVGHTVLEQVFDDGGVHKALDGLEVRTVATGNGSPGSGACCTGGETELFTDTKHPDWEGRDQSFIVKTMVHELTHVWQANNGATGEPAWFHEGVAEYMGYLALRGLGEMSDAESLQQQTFLALSTEEAETPLAELKDYSVTWPGHIGYIAVEALVDRSPFGARSLEMLAERLTDGMPWEDAIEQTFDVHFEEFVSSFDEWKGELVDQNSKLGKTPGSRDTARE